MATKATTKRGRGRPPLAKAERLTAVLAVRLRQVEKRHLAAIAKGQKKTLGEWARDALLAAGEL